MVAATSSIVLSNLDVAFFFQNIHVKHRDMYRALPMLLDLSPQDVISAYNPRAVRQPKKWYKVLSVIWVLIRAKPDFDAPARALRPRSVRDMLKAMSKTEFNPNASMFEDVST